MKKRKMKKRKRIRQKTGIGKGMIIFVIAFIIFLFLALTFYREKAMNTKVPDTWIGIYSYSEFYTFDNENIDVDFELIIYKDGGNYYAEFKNVGYLLGKKGFSELLCSRSLAYIKGNEESIDIYFKRTLPGDSLYGTSERYKRNELLLTLTYSGSELQSTWRALQGEEPVLSGSEEKMEGIYFTEDYLNTMEK